MLTINKMQVKCTLFGAPMCKKKSEAATQCDFGDDLVSEDSEDSCSGEASHREFHISDSET